MNEVREVTEPLEEPLEDRLERLRDAIREESISYFEIMELQILGEDGLIPEDDVELLEWGGVPEEEYANGTYAEKARKAKEGSA